MAEPTSTPPDPLTYMNTLILRATKTFGPDGALHLVALLNGVDPQVMAVSANQLKQANAK